MPSAAQALARDLADVKARLAAIERTSQSEFRSLELPDGGDTVDLTEALQAGMVASLDAATALGDASIAQQAADAANVAAADAQAAADAAALTAAAAETAANNIGPTQITDNAIQTRHITAGAIIAAAIAAGAIQAGHIAAGAIQAGHIAAAAIQAGNIAAGAIQTADLAAGAITADRLAANAIDGKTITGAVLRTAATNFARVEVNGTVANEVRFYGQDNMESNFAVLKQDWNSGSSVKIETGTAGTVDGYTNRSRYVIAPIVQGFYLRYWSGGAEPSTDNARIRLYKTPNNAISNAEVLADNVVLTAPSITVSSAVNPLAAWAAPTLGANWANFGGGYEAAGYMRDAAGVVHLKGLVKWNNATASSGVQTVFTLPAGFRPGANITFAVTTNSGTFHVARANVLSTGVVQFDDDTGGITSGEWLSLNGISFYVG